MNLLPTKDELLPITLSHETFYDCGFNTPFDTLTEKQKLQIICDVIKETIYPNPKPNPENDIITLNGNCHTACIVAKNYLEQLNLANNIEYVMARKRCFDPDDIASIHGILLVEGNDGKTYQFDPTPYIGYKFGYVEDIKYPFYEEYVTINDDMMYFINLYKEIIYLDSVGKIDKNKVRFYIANCISSLEYKILGAYAGNALKTLLKYIEEPLLKDKIYNVVISLRPYSKIFKQKKEYQLELLKKQILLWQEELNDLISSNDNIKRQSELCINIVQELKMLNSNYECFRNVNGVDVRLSFMNPRFMYEHGFNTSVIKTSAFYLKKDQYIKNYMSSKYYCTGEYLTDLSKPTKYTGVKPLLFSHPLGETCIRSLTGPSEVFLIKKDPETLLTEKRYLRETICGNMWGKKFIWFDSKPILWDPFVTNLIHASDNACESALHYAFSYPEHQSINRFMYPNPKLLYKRKQ